MSTTNAASYFVRKSLANKGSYILNNNSTGTPNIYFEYKDVKSEAAEKLEDLRDGKIKVPRWLFVGSLLILVFLIGTLIAALVLLLNTQKEGGLYDSCKTRKCSSVLNLKCIGGICQCENSTEYYSNKCTTLSSYLQSCFVLNNCFTSSNLTCKNSICDCSTNQYWNGKSCVDKLLYSIPCSANQCMSTRNLICSLTTSKCDCPDTTKYLIILIIYINFVFL